MKLKHWDNSPRSLTRSVLPFQNSFLYLFIGLRLIMSIQIIHTRANEPMCFVIFTWYHEWLDLNPQTLKISQLFYQLGLNWWLRVFIFPHYFPHCKRHLDPNPCTWDCYLIIIQTAPLPLTRSFQTTLAPIFTQCQRRQPYSNLGALVNYSTSCTSIADLVFNFSPLIFPSARCSWIQTLGLRIIRSFFYQQCHHRWPKGFSKFCTIFTQCQR